MIGLGALGVGQTRTLALARMFCVAGFVVAAGGCDETALLELTVVHPEGPDPLAGVTKLKLKVSNPRSESEFDTTVEAETSFKIERTVEVAGEVGYVSLEGFCGGQLLARGETPPLVFYPAEDRFNLMVARAGAFSLLKPRLPTAANGVALALMPAAGLLVAGGRGDNGAVLSAAGLYDFFSHQMTGLPKLPRPRSGARGISCGNRCALVVLGNDGNIPADQVLRFNGGTWEQLPDGLEPKLRREDPAAVALENGTYLIAGGVRDGVGLSSVLLLDPGDENRPPTLAEQAGKLRRPRKKIAAALTGPMVLLAGGQGDNTAVAELYSPTAESSKILSLPGPLLVDGAAATTLPDGRAVLLGGQDDQGKFLRDGWIVDGVTRQVTHFSTALKHGRAGHSLVRVGEHLVVVGGMTDNGLAVEAEILAADGLALLRSTPLQLPRTQHVVGRLSPGSFVLVGGTGEQGPTDRITLYETFAL